MRSKFVGLAIGFLMAMSGSFAQSQTADQLNALKNLSQDQQDAILQGVQSAQGVQGMSGKTDASGKKVDPKLNAPQTISTVEGDTTKIKEITTRDGRVLRMDDQNPELRADDTVLIDLTPIDQSTKEEAERRSQSQYLNSGLGAGGPFGQAGQSAGGVGTLGILEGAAGAGSRARNDGESGASRTDDYGRVQLDRKPKTEEETERVAKLRERILKNNPYRLNRFGVIEIPGLPAIPLAGLTAREATNRVSADPDLSDFTVKVTLLRLQTFDESSLKPFGYDLFEGVPSTFAPVSDIQVPVDYTVGVGDTLNVQLYGNEPATYELTVGRDGRINFPKLGPILVSGMSFDEAKGVIEQKVTQQLIGSRVSITMGSLRSIRVFVLGEGERPGSYTVSGLSTMTNALFVSGGVKKIGSLRRIELKRDGRLVSVLDLYDLLLHGDTSHDKQLQPGDVIFIPPVGKTVSVYGAVKRPAIYELKNETTAEQALEIAGGLLPDADAKTAQLERISPSQARRMLDVDLTSSGGRLQELANGDKLRVPLIRPTLERSVELAGYVFRPGKFEFHTGIRLSNVLSSFDELRPNADRHYVMIRREIPPEEKVQVISADLEKALGARGSPSDPLLQPRDQITVFNLADRRDRLLEPVLHDLDLQATPDKPAQIVSIDGSVNAPGRYPLEPTMRVSDLIRAGGSLEDSAYGGQAELTRYEIIDGNTRQTALIPIDLAAVRRGDPAADVKLMPYDLLVVKVTPQWEQPGSIVLSGELRFPGKYPILHGETLSSILRRAGGFTDLAFHEGAILIREELKKREKDQIEMLTTRLQSDLAALSLQALAGGAATNSSGSAGAGAAQGLLVGQQLIGQLRETKPVGRLVIDVDRIMKAPGSAGDIMLRDGDKLLIPKSTQEITILGEVQSPTSHVYVAGLNRDDYIEKSGGVTRKGDRKRIYVVRANGDVVTGERHGWFRRSQSIEIRPGDTIVVPFDAERLPRLPLLQSVSTIIYNLAVALLAVRSVN